MTKSPFTFCGNPANHLPHQWPTNAPDDEANTCEGRQFTTHPVTLKRVYVAGLGNRWQPSCALCGPLLAEPRKQYTDRESAEALAKNHERMVTA